MAEKAAHLQTGSAGEDAAASFARNLGWRILERNWRASGARSCLELDIVAMDGSDLVFVEVKSRSAKTCAPLAAGAGIPVHAAFTSKKKAALLRAATVYLTAKGLWHLPCRFDYMGVVFAQNGTYQVEHQRHVIEAGHSVGCRHSSWQPW